MESGHIIRQIDPVPRERATMGPKRSDAKNIVQVSPFPHAHLLPNFMVLIHEKSRRVFQVLRFYKVRLSSSFLKTPACWAFRKTKARRFNEKQ